MATSRRSAVPGLYESPLTEELDALVRELDPSLVDVEALDRSDAPSALSQLLHQRLTYALDSLTGDDALERQVTLANEVLALLQARAPDSGATDRFVRPARRLTAVNEPAVGLGGVRKWARPRLPLASSDLIVNGHHDVSLGPEVKRELASADRVDLLCSFLKWSGFRLVEDELRALCARRPGALRVLTTAYMSATDRRALDGLQALGAQVRVSYDTTRTRLHAKAWLFHRDTGFSTGCIGSSNLSAAAMLDGLEWNVRLSQRDNGPILDKFRTTFEQYWDDVEFRPYVAKEFDEAIAAQTNEQARHLFVFDVHPRPHQQEMLDDLAAERARGHFRNLVVAATGTGKTVVAALDYLRLRAELPRDRLLFVAHRKEILEQSLTTFQVVLRDAAFGELHVGDQRALRGEHVFASIQSFDERLINQLPPDAYDVLIVDEFHHAAAASYERLLAHFKPRVLLGLTATPERTDGQSVLHHFDGRIASELRLWKALDQNLLSPFHYFGVGGAPDLAGVRWVGGRYATSELSNVYTANDVFTVRVLQEVARRVRDVSTMRGLGFCVDVKHAEYLARKFTEAGLPSRAVSADTPKHEREAALTGLRQGQVRVVFSVDLFNEGVDVPDVDTVLFLRPTESATIFLQQLGRGLRKSRTKECLTVLDFIGNAHARFRFDLRYRAIVGGTRRSVLREVEEGFPSLPSGCVIELDRQSQASVLANLQQALRLGRRAFIDDLRQLGPQTTLAQFLAATDTAPEDLYVSGAEPWTFTRLRREAGFEAHRPGEADTQLERAFARLLHLDDRPRLEGLRALVSQAHPPKADPDDVLQRWLYVLLGYARAPLSGLGAAWKHLWPSPLRGELQQLLDVLADRSRWVPRPVSTTMADLPLQLHATYSLDEVMAGVDERNSKGGVLRIQTGVHFSKARALDLFFVTLEKSAQHYTPTTLYNDYPLSPTRFHWESQSGTHERTVVGQRYVRATRGAANRVMLFVRQRIKDERGETCPYVNLGTAFYRSHEGERPMRIEWDLEHAMPMGLYQETKRAAG